MLYHRLRQETGLSRTHNMLLELTGKHKTVLDVGCSTGYLGRCLTKEMSCIVDGIEIDPDAAAIAKHSLRQVYVGSVEDKMLMARLKESYDVILFGDVLEHLQHPELVLEVLSRRLVSEGYALISVPNVATWRVRRDLFFKGKFDYRDSGPLDRTHLRFFTYWSVDELVMAASCRVIQKYAVESDVPFAGVVSNVPVLRRLAPRMQSLILKQYPNLCCLQLVVMVARAHD